MSKFKVGDRVRGIQYASGVWIGEIYEVTKVEDALPGDKRAMITTVIKGKPFGPTAYESRFELVDHTHVQPKIGDKVRTTRGDTVITGIVKGIEIRNESSSFIQITTPDAYGGYYLVPNRDGTLVEILESAIDPAEKAKAEKKAKLQKQVADLQSEIDTL